MPTDSVLRTPAIDRLVPSDVPALAVAGLGHRYGDRTALAGVDFDVAVGERFGLLGPNGGGKTTLLGVVSTLIKPLEGSVRVFGADPVVRAADVRRLIGVAFQRAALDRELTVRENLGVQGALMGMGGRPLAERIDELLRYFGVADRAGDRISALSGGLARRVDLARGLLHRPRMLLLDEPTTGLDPLVRAELWDALDAARRADGTTQVVATHMMDEAERCDRVGILDRGRLVALGAPDALKAELGAEAIWLEGPDPERLASLLTRSPGVAARTVGRRVLVEVPDETGAAARLLPAVYDAAGGLVESASVRRPTLEDVFMVAAGHRSDEEADGLAH